jgi:LacI family transcriptional regulator
MLLGFSAASWQEIAGRWVDGILRYLGETPELGFRDFSFLEGMEMDELAPPPAWKAKVSGTIVGFGVRSDLEIEQLMTWLDRGNAPVVSLVWDWSHPRIPQVTTDISAVASCAVDYMIGKGFGRLLIIDDEGNSPKTQRWYRSFFTRRLASRGLEAAQYALSFRPEGVREDLERIRDEEGLAKLLRDSPKPLGVLAMGDPHARAVCSLCEDLGLEVPNEVAVLGVGDLNISRRHSPSISSVRTSAEDTGYEAAKLLHHMIKGEEPPDRPILIRPQGVIERESTCPNYSDSGDIRRAVNFIRTHACEGINVEDVVRHLAVSRRTLEKHFAKRIGHSPGHEIRQVRLDRAKQLLEETDMSITRISQLTGFREHARLTTFLPQAYRPFPQRLPQAGTELIHFIDRTLGEGPLAPTAGRCRRFHHRTADAISQAPTSRKRKTAHEHPWYPH